MCGIAGFSRNTARTSIPNGRDLAIDLAHAIESRGKDATGFAWQEKGDDENTWYSKRKGKASNVAKLLALPYNGITNLAAHTRYLTLGSADNNDNNHPVTAEGITAVHNGRISNHNELIALSGLDRVGAVDSWAIPALLSQQAALGASHPKELLELIEGVASMCWFNMDEPGVMHLARCSTRPLTLGWTKKGDLVFSSTRQTLEAGMKRAKIGVSDVIDVPEGTYIRVRDGAFEEWATFKVTHPPITMGNDMPGGKASKATKSTGNYHTGTTMLPASGVTSYHPDPKDFMWDDDREEAENYDRYLDNLADFDSWEAQVDARIDGIDWDNLIPRRGHAGYTG